MIVKIDNPCENGDAGDSESGHARQAFAKLTPDQILDAVETLGVRCDGRFLALNSYENRVYRIGLEDRAPVVVKFYRPQRWSDRAILEEHAFTLTLAQQEVPVIAPWVDEQGHSLHRAGPFRFAVYPCQGGRAPELDNPEQLELLGRFIARIHALGGIKPFTCRPQLDIEGYAIRPARYLQQQGFIPDHLVAAYASLTTDLIEQLQISFARAGKIRSIRLHGDCHPGNILWSESGPQIVDFDDARMGPAVQDLWMFLAGEPAQMRTALGHLLEGYGRFADFNPAEIQLIEPLRTLRLIHYAGWLASRWDDPAFPLAFPWFNTTRYWEEHILILREQAALLAEPTLI
jgi:Ser/Thr protein kinase RdoA (MazF antagonist)